MDADGFEVYDASRWEQASDSKKRKHERGHEARPMRTLVAGMPTREARSKRSTDIPKMCLTCCVNNVETIFVGCGHAALCKECAPKISRCTMCRRTSEWIEIKVSGFDK